MVWCFVHLLADVPFCAFHSREQSMNKMAACNQFLYFFIVFKLCAFCLRSFILMPTTPNTPHHLQRTLCRVSKLKRERERQKYQTLTNDHERIDEAVHVWQNTKLFSIPPIHNYDRIPSKSIWNFRKYYKFSILLCRTIIYFNWHLGT